MNSATPSLSPAGLTVSYIFSAGHRGHDRDSPLPGVAIEPGCFLSGKGGRHVPLSRRDIMRIARRFNAGKHRARRTSPEGTAEGWCVGLDFSRPFGTRDLLASNPALKRWAYSYPRVIHRSEESPQELLPAASVNNSAAQKVLGMNLGKISLNRENTHRPVTNSTARHSTPNGSPSSRAMRWSLTNTQRRTASISRSHYKPFARISQRVFRNL